MREWLPFVGINWRLDTQTSVVASAGRTYGLDVNLFPYYYAQQANFKAKGVSFQSLWNRLELETADNIDLGLRHAGAGWSAGATVFYALHRNKQSTVYDPAVGLRYPWNSADARRYGIELEGQVALGEAKLLGVTFAGEALPVLVAKVGANTRLIVEEVRKLGQTDDIKNIWAGNGAEFGQLSQADFGKMVGSEVRRWAQVVKASGARLE